MKRAHGEWVATPIAIGFVSCIVAAYGPSAADFEANWSHLFLGLLTFVMGLVMTMRRALV